MEILTNSLLTEQEHRLLLYHINTIKQLMIDIQQYGIRWLQGQDRIDKAAELHHYNMLLLHYQSFIESIKPPAIWVTIYNILIITGASPIDSLFTCLNGLERLTNDITISMNTVCSVVTDPTLPLQCSTATLQHRHIKRTLLQVTSDLLGCSCSVPDTLIFLLKDILCKIDFYGLTPIHGLKEALRKSNELCLTIRVLDHSMDKGICARR